MKKFVFVLFFPFFSIAALKFPSDRLKVMDVETLQRIVAKNLSVAQKAVGTNTHGTEETKGGSPDYSEGARLIKESLELIFACPEQNATTSQIYSSIEGLAIEYGGIHKFLSKITDEAIRTLKQSGKDKTLLQDQNTYLYILNNMMAENKSLILSEETMLYRKITEKIRDADIHISESLKSYRALNSLSNTINPSRVARDLIGKKKCSWWQIFGC